MTKNLPTIDEVTALHRAGKLIDAKQGYLAILKANPKEVTVLHLLGVLYAEEGEFDEARTYLEQAIELSPEQSIFYLHLANILKASGLFAHAIEVLNKLLTMHPDYAAAHNNLGTIYYAIGKLEKAVYHFQQAVALQADYVDAYYNLGLALSKTQQLTEAENIFQALLELVPEHAGGRFHLASLLMAQQKYEAAVKHLLLIVNTHHFHFESETNLATCYLKLGRLVDAKAHYVKALNIEPRDTQILFNLGIIATQLGFPQEAIDYYLQALAINPDLFEVHNNLGVSYMALQNRVSALVHFREALKLQPHNIAIQHLIDIITHEKDLSRSPPDYIRSLFDAYADHYDTHLINALHYQVPQMMWQFVNAGLALKASKATWDVLDLGCGTGLCGEIFKPLARSLVGVDLSEKMLAQAAQKRVYDALIQTDIVPFLADKIAAYDLIIAGDVLVYFGDLLVLFQAVSRALKVGGCFVFNAEISRSKNFYMTDSGRFAHHKAYLDKLISENGMRIVRYEATAMRTQDQAIIKGHLYLVQKH